MKTVTQIIFKILFLVVVALIAFAWWIQSELGNDVEILNNVKNHINHKVQSYKQEKENAVATYIEDKKVNALNKINEKLKDAGLVDEQSVVKTKGKKPVDAIEKKPEITIVKNENDNKQVEKPVIKNEPKNVSEFNHLSIPFFYDPSSAPQNWSKDQVLSLMNKVSDTWTQACNISFDYRGDRLSDYVDGNNTMPGREGLVKWGNLPGSAIGRAHQGNNYGYAKGFVLMLNKNFFAKAQNEHFLYSTVLHEAGHVIGLPHSKNSNSIMFWQQDNRKQVLNDTDKTMCKYYRARWSGLSANAASDKYGILMNESSENEQPEEE